jgi:hypothetical protein
MISQFTLEDYKNLVNQIKTTKVKARPERNRYEGKYERKDSLWRRERTRPWDKCWFSNKPHIINLTVEEAANRYPDYMKWVYRNLRGIKWSVFTERLLMKL